MFEKEAEEYEIKVYGSCDTVKGIKEIYHSDIYEADKDGSEYGFQKGIKTKVNTTTISDCPVKDEWHYVKDGDLPKEDLRPRTFGYYLTASKHKSYKGFVFEVAYFTGVVFTKG